MNAWAEAWVSYWTGGRGRFAMTAEEDAGILQSLTFLARADRVNLKRVMVLRTASNYTVPASGTHAAELLATNAGAHGESAYLEAIDAAYRVGSTVVNELTAHWAKYSVKIPGPSQR